MESLDLSTQQNNSQKKRLDINENKQDLDTPIKIFTNLSILKVNEARIKGLYLYGCVI